MCLCALQTPPRIQASAAAADSGEQEDNNENGAALHAPRAHAPSITTLPRQVLQNVGNSNGDNMPAIDIIPVPDHLKAYVRTPTSVYIHLDLAIAALYFARSTHLSCCYSVVPACFRSITLLACLLRYLL